MVPIFLAVSFLLLMFGPSVWAKYVLNRYNGVIEDLPGTGGDFAKTLLATLEIVGVTIESTPGGDHYDPTSRCVRLSEAVFNGRSITAMTVAAHEVAHAQQDMEGYAPFRVRGTMVAMARSVEKISAVAFAMSPVMFAITKSFPVSAVLFFAAFGAAAITALVHLITLPVELNASFARAFPTMVSGGYITQEEESAVKKVLLACALTYVATSLAGIFNLWRILSLVIRK